MGKSRPQRKLRTAVPPQTGQAGVRQPTRKDKYVNRVLPLAGEWKFARTAERITWWQTGDTETAHWSTLLFSFLLVCGGMIAVFVFGFLASAVLIVIASFFKSESMGTFPSEDYKIFWWILIVCVVMGGAFSAMIASTKHVFRFEIDLEGKEISLYESYFPNRRRVLRVPFSSITSIRPRKMKTYGGADLELRYANQGGAQVQKSLGMDLPEDILKEHLDCLRPAINDRVLELIDYAD
jgi:hypothetical protein